MNCYQHVTVGGVAQCADCGKGLCQECAEKFRPILCNECLLERASANRTQLIKNAVLMVILFIIGFNIMKSDPSVNFGIQLLYGYVFAGIPFGWSALTRITPSMFLYLSWFGWAMYFISKAVLSMMIGAFVTPFKIFTMIKEIATIKEVVALAK